MKNSSLLLTCAALLLSGCAEKNAEVVQAAPSAATSAMAVPEKPSVKRKVTPQQVRIADEKACLAGKADGCRRMADRYRGYGHPAGCGIERKDGTIAHGRVVSSMPVRMKRVLQDVKPDNEQFLEWIGKACDLGDSQACDIERVVRGTHEPASTFDRQAMATRSDPNLSALMAFHALWRPDEHAKLLEKRQEWLSKDTSDSVIFARQLANRRKEDTRPDLTPEIVVKLQAICDQTLDCDSVLMMLDKHGYPPEVLAPIRAHSSKALVKACEEGSCVCGNAAASLPADDPRVVELARWGCENGEASGCQLLAKLHEEGSGVEKDPAFARSLYEVACPPIRDYAVYSVPEYSPRACQRLAEIAEGGVMPPKDKERATYYAEFSCLRPGLEPDHAPCVKYARYWANGVLTSDCSGYDRSWCKSTVEQAEEAFFGGKNPPAEAKECERPSVKALCDAHRAEIEELKKPGGKKK